MTTTKTALALMVLYWAVAVVGALVAPMQGWIDLRWPIAIYFFAIPVTLLLWLLYAASRRFPRLIAGRRFMAIGLVLPVIYVAVASNGGRLLDERVAKRLEYQQDAALLETLVDEPLRTDHGVIGIRLRYRIAYPKGLDLDEWHGAFAELGLNTTTRSGFGGFMTLKRRVRPAVGGRYPPGSYEITEDFAPLFLSDALQKRIGGQAITQIPTPMAEPAARCLRWSIPYDREALLTAPPQPMQVAIYVARTPVMRATSRSYRVGEFFETALALGALDCSAH